MYVGPTDDFVFTAGRMGWGLSPAVAGGNAGETLTGPGYPGAGALLPGRTRFGGQLTAHALERLSKDRGDLRFEC